MTRDDILGGLKNAMERGITLEQAVRSFINAGYNETEVRQAASQITSGTLQSLSSNQPQPAQPQPQIQRPPQQMPASKPAQVQQQMQPARPLPVQNQYNRPFPQPLQQGIIQPKASKPRGLGLVITLTILLLVLIAVLLATIFFKDQITSIIQNLF